MLSEPKTLYKLMNLYMLKQVNFPLTNSQLTDFFLQHEYTSYFALQQVLNELLEAGLIRVHTNHNMSRYEITKEGDDTLSFFGNNISPAIIEDIDSYLKENKFRLRNEVGVISDFYKSTNQDYIVHCEVREGKSVRPRQGSGRDDGQPLEGAESGYLRLCDEDLDERLRYAF